jgi:hypothetical protein
MPKRRSLWSWVGATSVTAAFNACPNSSLEGTERANHHEKVIVLARVSGSARI